MIAKNEHRILWLPTEERMWDDDGGSRSSSGVRIDSNNAHTVAAVFACLRVIAETVASLPLHVLERTPGGGDAASDGPAGGSRGRPTDGGESGRKARR